MQLVEILLPVTEGEGVRREVEALGKLFTDKFGGLTAFVRSPGEGVWDDAGAVHCDDVVVLEVMTEELDRNWWRELRLGLEDRLHQKEIVMRTHAVEML